MSFVTNGLNNTLTSLVGGTNVSPIDLNRIFNTGYSTLQNGNLRLDPTIRQIQDQALTGYTNLLPAINSRFDTTGLRGVSSNLSDIASQLTGNRNAFIQARVNPLRQALALRRGELQQSLNRRGVFGTFGNQDLTNLDITGNQAIGDAQTQALEDALNAQLGVNQAQASVQGQIIGAGGAQTSATMNALSAINGLGAQRFAQEMAALGLSADTINALLGLQQRAQQAQDVAGAQGVKNISGIATGILSGSGGGGTGFVNGGYGLGSLGASAVGRVR